MHLSRPARSHLFVRRDMESAAGLAVSSSSSSSSLSSAAAVSAEL